VSRRPQLNTVCGRCGKPRGNPLTHTCHTTTDFKQRKARYQRQQRAAKSGKPAHDYQACSDNACPRPLCVAFKTGYQAGDRDGYEHGWQQGHDRGYAEGQAACPRPHK
jgi:hypothetical protein